MSMPRAVQFSTEAPMYNCGHRNTATLRHSETECIALELIIRTLQSITPTAEQLSIFSRTRSGVELIRGAAGSGKTTTALLKLRSLIAFFVNRRRRNGSSDPVRVLVLTYNRTLRGYIRDLTLAQTNGSEPVELEVETFAKWSLNRLSNPTLLSDDTARIQIATLGKNLPLDADFLGDEVEYLLGRFLTKDLDRYVTSRREGRGTVPRVERSLRQQILDQVVGPYNVWKQLAGKQDWNDLALELAAVKMVPLYDVIIVDETQDFSANQIRAVMNQLQTDHSATFVLDSAQRIYPRGFSWAEAGLTITSENSKRLTKNYRNTIEIATLAAALVKGLSVDDDGTIPMPASCSISGSIPQVAIGLYSKQLEFSINHIQANVDLSKESVAFLHPKGGRWFDALRASLNKNGLSFVELSRKSDWPAGDQNIGLSTLHSAKGLEFDHVIVLGLNSEVTRHGQEEDDETLSMLRRLLAMGIGRARKSVILGYKPGEVSKLLSFIDASCYQEIFV